MPAVPVLTRAAAPAAPVGARWALLLGAALLLGMALLAGARWLGPADPPETVVQQPITPADSPPARPALTAPDPGDNP